MKFFTLAALLSAGIPTAFAAPGAIHLVQKPAMNRTDIVFSYSGDLWRVSREGGVATRLTSGPGFETDAAFADVLDGENPVESVERALVQVGVVLHCTLDARDNGRFGAAVGAMKQGQSIGSPFTGKIGDQAVDAPLHLLLPAQAVLATVPRAIEEVESGDFAAWSVHPGGAEMVKNIAKIVRRRAGLPGHVLVKQPDVFAVRHDAPVACKSIAHLARKLSEPGLGIEFRRHRHPDRSTRALRRVYSQQRQGTV